MLGFFQDLFGTSAFMPHGHCYLWTPALLWTEVVTNGLIAAAYFVIAAGLAVLVHRIEELPFGKFYWAFSAFIFACGVTHVFDIIVIWEPNYWLDAGLRAVTAAASVGTAILLVPVVPRAVTLIRGARSSVKEDADLEAILQDLESVHAARLLLQRELESQQEDISEMASQLTDKTSVLEQLALYDQLTDLPNRGLLEDRIEQAVERAKRRGTPFALAFIDFDDFKSVNDTLGHAAGDALIRQAADRLRETVRGEDTVARIGGDEFVVLLEAVDEPSKLDRVGERIAASFEPPFSVAETDLDLSISVGFAYPPPSQFSGDGPHFETDVLMERADGAMYEAKSETGTSWRIVEVAED